MQQGQRQKQKSFKILIVEDNHAALTLVQNHLQREGYSVDSVTNGKQAFCCLQKNSYNLILLDYTLPDITVRQFVADMKKQKYEVPFIIMTGHGDEKITVEMMKLGAQDYLVKDCDFLNFFVQVVKQVLNKLYVEKKLAETKEILKRRNAELFASNKALEKKIIELEQVKEKLVCSYREFQQFAHVVSHDLKEPLRAITTFAGFLMEDYMESLDKEGKHLLNRIEMGGKRMQRLIDDLLEYAKIGNARSTFESINLLEVIKNVKLDLEILIREKNANIETGELLTIQGNPLQIQQVFFNLIGNALKYAKKDRPSHIKVYGKIIDDFYKITVEDNGIGFEKKYAQRIFDIFKRLHCSEMCEGSGIGLAICKKIIEKHQGYIVAESKEGEGSKFTVAFPLSDA